MSNAVSGDVSAVKPAFLAFAGDPADIVTLRAFASAHGCAESTIHQGDIKTATHFLKNNPSPAILLVELPSAAEAPALLDGLADVCDPGTKVITIGSVNEYSFYCWLMDLGIFSYLLKPLTQTALDGAWQKALEPPAIQANTDKKPAMLIAVTGTRGGVGATAVATNLAAILAGQTQKHIALVDIDPQEGSVALALDIEPSRGFRDALEKPDRIDSLFIERVMNKPMKHLSVLSAEESLQDQLHIHEQAAETLVKELRGKFDIVVLDIPRYLNQFSRQCLKQADHVVLVTELTLLSLRDALRLGDLMRDSLKMKAPLVVANRIGLAAKQEVLPADFEKGLNVKIASKIPFAPELYMPIGSDIPSIKHKNHAAVRPLYALAEQLVPEAKEKMEIKPAKGFSLFSKKKEA